jgi:hypothetical protein
MYYSNMSKIKVFDLLSSAPHLYIFGERKYQTFIGALFSIIIVILWIFCLFAFGIDIINKKKPISVMSREYIETPVINRSDIMFALNPVFISGEPIKDLNRKLSISMTYVNSNPLNLTNPTTWKPIPLMSCVNSKMYKNNTMNFTKLLSGNAANAACLPDDFEGDIRGKLGDPLEDVYVFSAR